MKSLGFTGTQDVTEISSARRKRLKQVLERLRAQGYERLLHGDCVGADAMADGFARTLGYRIIIYPPDNDSKRAFCSAHVLHEPAPYLERNHMIVNHCQLLIAFPRKPGKEVLRSGTWATVRYARKIGRKVVIV